MKKYLFLFIGILFAQNNGIRSLNGSLSGSQSLRVDTTAARFAWTLSNGVHTLSIPYRIVVPSGSSFKWNVSGSAQQQDSLRFIASTNISLSQSGNTITIASTGSTATNTDSLGHVYYTNYALKSDSAIIAAGYGIGVSRSGHTSTVSADSSVLDTKGTDQVLTGAKYIGPRWYFNSSAVDTLSARSTTKKQYLTDTVLIGGKLIVGPNHLSINNYNGVIAGEQDSILTTSSYTNGQNFVLGRLNTVGRINTGNIGGNWLFGQYLRSENIGVWAFGADDNFEKKLIPFAGSVVFVNEGVRHWLSNTLGFTGLPAPQYGIQSPHVGDSALFAFRYQKLGSAVDTLAYPALHYTIERGFSVSALSNGEKYLIANTANRIKRIWSINENNDDAWHFNTLNTSGRPFGNIYVDSAHFIVSQGYLDADSLRSNGTTVATSGVTHSGLGSWNLGAIGARSLTLVTALDTAYSNAVSKITAGYGITATKNAKDYTITFDSATVRSKFIPYSGANATVDLGAQALTSTGNFTGGAITANTNRIKGTAQVAGIFYRTSSVAGDDAGIAFDLQNAGSTEVSYANIKAKIQTNTTSLHSGKLEFYTTKSNVSTLALTLDSSANATLVGRMTSVGLTTTGAITATSQTIASGAITSSGKSTFDSLTVNGYSTLTGNGGSVTIPAGDSIQVSVTGLTIASGSAVVSYSRYKTTAATADTIATSAVYTAGKLSIYGKFGWIVKYFIVSR